MSEFANEHLYSKKEKKTYNGFRFVISGEVIYEEEGISAIDFLHMIFSKNFDIRTNLFLDNIDIRLVPGSVLESRCMTIRDAIGEYTVDYVDISNPVMKDIIALMLQFIVPRVNHKDVDSMVFLVIKAIAKQKTSHYMADFMKLNLERYTDKDGKEAFDRFIGYMTFFRQEIKDKYKELIRIYLCGLIHNLFVEDLRRKQKDENYEFDLIERDEIMHSFEAMPHGIPCFNGIIIFTGAPGIGKSVLVNQLLPVKIREFMHVGSDLIPQGDDISHTHASKLKGTILLNLEDIEELQLRRFPKFLKSQLERTHWSYRYLYENRIRKVARRFTPIATSNEMQIIYDTKGNRRILPIYLRKISRNINLVNREALLTYLFKEWKKDMMLCLDWYNKDKYFNAFEDICTYHYGSDFENFGYVIRTTVFPYSTARLDAEGMKTLRNECAHVMLTAKSDASVMAYFFNKIKDFGYVPITFPLLNYIFSHEKVFSENILKKLGTTLGFSIFRILYDKKEDESERYTYFIVAKRTESLRIRIQNYFKGKGNYGWNFTFEDLDTEVYEILYEREHIDEDTLKEGTKVVTGTIRHDEDKDQESKDEVPF